MSQQEYNMTLASSGNNTQQQVTRGIRGILNCPDVINVITQILSHLDPYVDKLLFKQKGSELSTTDHTRSELGVAFDRACKSLWGINDENSTANVIDGSSLGTFFPNNESGYSMDFVESFSIVLDACGGEFDFCKGSSSNSITSKGCPMCGSSIGSERSEDFCVLKVSSNQWKEFEQTGVLNMIEREALDGYRCSLCTYASPVEIVRSVTSAPDILAIELDRFYLNFETFQTAKKNDLYKVYLNQEFKLLMSDNSIQAYNLVAVVDHYGMQTTGSYGGFFFNPTNRRWYRVSSNTGEVPSIVKDLSSINTASNSVFFFQKALEKKSSWQTTALSSHLASDISFSFTEDEI